MWALGMPLGYVIELTNSGCQTSTVWDEPLGVIDLIAEYLKRRGSQYSNGKEPARFSRTPAEGASFLLVNIGAPMCP
eukprot:COSAG02_NODE_6555_length_3499_cov_3.124706_6_plen_77_part_00